MNNLLNQVRTYLIPVVSILVVIALVPLVIVPQVQKIAADWQVVSKDSQRLENLEDKAAALEELALATEELDKDLEIAESALPIEKDVARLVRGVQNLAIASGLEVSKVDVKPGKTATDSASPQGSSDNATVRTSQTSSQAGSAQASTSRTELLFELVLKGNLTNFQSFLKSVEATKRLLIMSTLKSTSTTGSDFSFNVVINAPFGPLPKISSDQLSQALVQLSSDNKKLLEDLESSLFKNVTNDPLPTGPTGVTDPFTK